MNIPCSKNTGEREHKYVNIPRSKNTKGSVNETLHGQRSLHSERGHKQMRFAWSFTPLTYLQYVAKILLSMNQ